MIKNNMNNIKEVFSPQVCSNHRHLFQPLPDKTHKRMDQQGC